MAAKQLSLFDRYIIISSLGASFKKLHPLTMMRNPVMFVTEVGALITTVSLFFQSPGESIGFGLQVAIWLWFTVLFANFAEAMAEGRGKAQADTLRKTRTQTLANRTLASGKTEKVSAEMLRKGDVVVALVDNEATVKSFYPQNRSIELRPANPIMEPLRYPADKVSILGVVVSLQRSLG